jgi:hypothetical protein
MKTAMRALMVVISLVFSDSALLAAPLPHGIKEYFDGRRVVRTVKDGEVCDPSTWDNPAAPGKVPQPDDYVVIRHKLNLMPTCKLDCKAVTIRDGGRLMSEGPISVHTLVVYPTGVWEHSAGSITIKSGPFLKSVVGEEDNWSRGLLCFGMTAIKGKLKDPFLRAGAEPRRGQSSILVERIPIGWAKGDQIVVPDTRHMGGANELPWQVERRSIVSIDGATIRLDRPLSFDHQGARNQAGQIERLPHIINLTRSIRIAPENPAEPGHIAFFDDAAIEWAEVFNMGRSTIAIDSPRGRYPLHWHHSMGPPRCVGCTVWNDEREGGSPAAEPPFRAIDKLWGIVVHGSNFGLVEKCVCYAYGGAGIVTEVGAPMEIGMPRVCETGNVFRNNLTCLSLAPGGALAKQKKGGKDGAGFWAKGQPNSWIDNYAYDTDSSGFLTMGDDGNSLVAVAERIDQPRSQWPLKVSESLQLIENRGFEAWSCGEAWSLWRTGLAQSPANPRPNIVTGSVAIHCQLGIFPYYEGLSLIVDGFTAYGGEDAATDSSAIVVGGAILPTLEVRNATIHRYPIGVHWRARGRMESARFLGGNWNCTRAGLLVDAWQQNPGGGGQDALFENVKIVAPHQIESGDLQPRNNLLEGLRIKVRGNVPMSSAAAKYVNFRFYMLQQAPEFVIPAGEQIPAELVGLTNAQALKRFGKCINGEIVPAGAMKNPPGIVGYVLIE